MLTTQEANAVESVRDKRFRPVKPGKKGVEKSHLIEIDPSMGTKKREIFEAANKAELERQAVLGKANNPELVEIMGSGLVV